jgi:uncharacterized protein (DUF305 family)
MRTRQLSAALAGALAAVLTLAGCSVEINAGDDGATGGSSGGGEHNAADVRFATEMIPHHAQALAMIAMTRNRDVSSEFEDLVQGMADTQRAEIALMAGWLRDWGEEVPDSWGMGGGRGGEMRPDPEGGSGPMMDRDDMRDMMGPQRSPSWRGGGPRFEDMWLRMMIGHHEGAIEISAAERAEGGYGPARDLADQIILSQGGEIEVMEDMLR